MIPSSSTTYTTQQLKDALASLAIVPTTTTIITNDNNKNNLVEDCKHIYGLNHNQNNNDDSLFFKSDFKLSMLQTITARRILDYNHLMVRFLL